MSVHNFQVKTVTGEEKQLSDYQGKVLLIVNTASKCGFTPQFEGLQNLYEDIGNDKFEILGFPCNQFGNQDPGADADIHTFCTKNYGVTFPMFSKVNVKGQEQHPLFSYLTKEQKGFLTEDIKWNFTKFLIDKDGNVINRFAPQKEPEKIKSEIEELMEA